MNAVVVNLSQLDHRTFLGDRGPLVFSQALLDRLKSIPLSRKRDAVFPMTDLTTKDSIENRIWDVSHLGALHLAAMLHPRDELRTALGQQNPKILFAFVEEIEGVMIGNLQCRFNNQSVRYHLVVTPTGAEESGKRTHHFHLADESYEDAAFVLMRYSLQSGAWSLLPATGL